MSHDSTFDEFHRYRNTICVGSVFGVTHTTVFNACSMFAWIFYLPASSDTAGGGVCNAITKLWFCNVCGIKKKRRRIFLRAYPGGGPARWKFHNLALLMITGFGDIHQCRI